MTNFRDLGEQYLEELKKGYQEGRLGVSVAGVSTGFSHLDYLTHGLVPADLIVVAGYEWAMPDGLAIEVARNAAVRSRSPVLFFALENEGKEIVMRMLCAESLVSTSRIHRGLLKEKEWEKINRAFDKMADTDLVIDDTPGLRVDEMIDEARRFKDSLKEQGKQLGLIVVDHLGLVSHTRFLEDREHELSERARSLKNMADNFQAARSPGLQACSILAGFLCHTHGHPHPLVALQNRQGR